MKEIALISSRLRANAEELSAGLPALLARAERLAATLSLGSHGRRRAGHGEEFWQFRPSGFGDTARDIDWRRSGRSDDHFVRQMEFQSAQSVSFWVDQSQAMQFENKSEQAQLIALACSMLLLRAGERVGLLATPEPAHAGMAALDGLAYAMTRPSDAEYGVPPVKPLTKGSYAVFLSDFLGDWDEIVEGLAATAAQDVAGCLVQILDPTEVSFPFKGRTLFESMKSAFSFETMRAQSLHSAYVEKLVQRQDKLRDLARRTGWRFEVHVCDTPPLATLLWLYGAIGRGPV